MTTTTAYSPVDYTTPAVHLRARTLAWLVPAWAILTAALLAASSALNGLAG